MMGLATMADLHAEVDRLGHAEAKEGNRPAPIE